MLLPALSFCSRFFFLQHTLGLLYYRCITCRNTGRADARAHTRRRRRGTRIRLNSYLIEMSEMKERRNFAQARMARSEEKWPRRMKRDFQNRKQERQGDWIHVEVFGERKYGSPSKRQWSRAFYERQQDQLLFVCQLTCVGAGRTNVKAQKSTRRLMHTGGDIEGRREHVQHERETYPTRAFHVMSYQWNARSCIDIKQVWPPTIPKLSFSQVWSM